MASAQSTEILALQAAVAGRYSIERELGRGGMGIVLLARDVALDRLVAIKLLPPALAADRAHRARFLQEARTAAALSHPNIVPIHSVEEHGEFVFFVMAFVDGETLRQRVERAGPMTARQGMRLAQEVAWALSYAHDRGVVHRDVKPDNIMLETGSDRALVADFGIAQPANAGGHAGEAAVVGTARYMSPEQASGEPVDARSDLYSLGATCFYALTGRAPFEARTVPAILMKQVAEPAPPLQSLRPDIPPRVAVLIDRCLAKSPAERPQTGDEVVAAAGAARGRDLRAPPLVRSFVRNAEITTMVLLAAGATGISVQVTETGITSVNIGPGIIGLALLVQLVLVARRLLRDGYAFADIRAALLAEAQIQAEEAEIARRGRMMRRLQNLWHRLWAGRLGRTFFRVAGLGLQRPEHTALPSGEPTEFVLQRAAVDAYESLTATQRSGASAAPAVIDMLAHRAERLRQQGETGSALEDTVGALERVRLSLLALQAGEDAARDLTRDLEKAREIGERVDAELDGR